MLFTILQHKNEEIIGSQLQTEEIIEEGSKIYMYSDEWFKVSQKFETDEQVVLLNEEGEVLKLKK